jgi:hypothetical protein
VQRLDHRDQPRPWHAALHLAVELLAAVRFFFIANSTLAKLRCLIVALIPFGLDLGRTARTARRRCDG